MDSKCQNDTEKHQLMVIRKQHILLHGTIEMPMPNKRTDDDVMCWKFKASKMSKRNQIKCQKSKKSSRSPM